MSGNFLGEVVTSMSKKDLERFAEKLRAEKSRILNHQTGKDELTLSTDDLADEVDLASSELNQNLTLRLRDRERSLLQKIEVALSKIEHGTFGICDACEEQIEPKRLEVRPVADMCIRCKEAEELKEKIYA